MPCVSIIMAVFNGKHFLPPTMRSVLSQTFGDFEFIVIDDGSTDGVTDLLRQYAKEDSRIRLIVRENKGLTPSLNEALRLAESPLIARMDSDDIARPDRLAKQVQFMNANPQCVLLGGAYELIDEHGRLLTTLSPPLDDASLQQQCLDGTTPICHPLAMFRRDAAREAGGYDESFTVAQDLDFWLRLGEIGQLACLPDVLLQYRMHEKSVSEKKQAQQVANMKRACEAAWRRRGLGAGNFKGADGWRAQSDSSSRLKQTLKFGWWAFNSGQRRTARSYGLRAIKMSPFKSDGYRLVYASFKPKHSRAT
ncbi:MAG: glycosyltransferase [Burkholderiales bacterium]|nr:glycosyltransferase [Phycisphaerae bacterium]